MARLTVSFSVIALLLLFVLVAAGASCGQVDSLVKLMEVSKPCFGFIDKNKDGKLKAENIPAECCSAVKGADVACICSFVPGFVNKYISMERLVFAVQHCVDNKLAEGSKCGNYVVPSSGLGGN